MPASGLFLTLVRRCACRPTAPFSAETGGQYDDSEEEESASFIRRITALEKQHEWAVRTVSPPPLAVRKQERAGWMPFSIASGPEYAY